jgi:pimeloyl-ACP methyl ester carboxylesterase
MNQTQRRRLIFGIAAGAAAGATALLVRRAQAARLALARRVDGMTGRAVKGLDVPASAESRFVLVNGLNLHAVVAGPEDGPLAVLLHGFPECWYSWRHQIAPLVGAGYRVVVPDQRGYNLSDKPTGTGCYRIDRLTADVHELVRAFGRERAVVVGHDWGGVVAWRLAMDYPAVVEKLIVMNAPHPVAFARELSTSWSQRLKSWYMVFFQLPWLPETLLTLSPMATARLFFRRTAVRAQAFSDADLEVMAAALAQPGAMRTMIHWYRAAFRHPSSRRTQVIETPTLLIWGEDDVALGKPLTYGLEKWVPDLSIHYIPRCGHWVQNEAPDEVNERMVAFASTTDGP